MTDFGSSKSDLSLRYRLGMEQALAKADLFDAPDLILVQALAIFLTVARRHESPRFVWMMSGIAIRMAQYLGLQRDGARFKHMTPYEIEMRRRVWWVVCNLDLRASEDQGTDLTITTGSFDTKIPLNIDDEDIDPDTKEMPTPRDRLTSMSMACVVAEICNIMLKMMAIGARDDPSNQERQTLLLEEMYQKGEQGYLRYTEAAGGTAYWVTVALARLVLAKMTLIVFLPILFPSSSNRPSDEIRTKLLVSAIEVAESNHTLNSDQAFRQWRWLYQSHTHWHAIVYLLIEIPRRHWSPIVERAWIALHSTWLIPAQTPVNKYLRIWVPLRRLIAKARKHRESELARLRADPQAAARLEMEDREFLVPSSSGPFPAGSSVDIFRERWRQLVTMPNGPADGKQKSVDPRTGNSKPTSVACYSMYFDPGVQQAGQTPESTNSGSGVPSVKPPASSESSFVPHNAVLHNSFPTVPSGQPNDRAAGYGVIPWLWADESPPIGAFSNLEVDPVEVNMNLDGEVNWQDWIQSAMGMQRESGYSGNTWN
jgi:hypothetical protein